MKIKNINKNSVIKYLLIFLTSLILANAEIGNLNPFLYAFFFACLYAGLDEKLLATTCLTSSIVILPTLENLFVSLTVVAVGLCVLYIHKFTKRKIHLVTVFFTYLISLVIFVYYNIANLEYVLLYILLGIILIYVFIVVLQIVFIRKNFFKLMLDETISLLFFISILGVGISSLSIFNFSLARLILMLSVFIFVGIGSPSITYSFTLSFSLGFAISQISLVPVAEFLIIALLCSVFAMPNKFKIITMSLISDAFLQYFFINNQNFIFFELLPVLIAGIIFILIPSKFINKLQDMVYVKKSEIASRNVINTTRKNIKKRMAELSNVFLDMKQIHLNMVKKDLSKEELVSMLNREIISSCCKDCLDKNKCNKGLGTDNKSNLETIINIALTKGKVSLLDIPNGLTNRCLKINNLISLTNRLTSEYKQYKNMMSDVNNVKILLADQMGAVSKLLLDIGNEIDTNVKFDIAQENKIISRLLSQNIYCKEVLLYTEKNSDTSAVLVVKGNDCYNPIIEKVVSETLKQPMQVSKVLPLEEGGFNSVSLNKKSNYDCAFGLSSCNKAGEIECGDCHSIIRLNKNRFLLALCDGMGSGKSANIMSAMTLGLIENFYKVGFNNEVIMESVNKLLAVSNQENYATLDVCVLDLDKQIADFIKVGAPFGLIKHECNIETVAGGALPIGALDKINPAIYKTPISVKDIIILATDGIIDAFGSEEAMSEYVGKLASNNPQTLADSILNEALALNEMSAKDDMTVLVARTYLKN